jgi:endoglucanase
MRRLGRRLVRFVSLFALAVAGPNALASEPARDASPLRKGVNILGYDGIWEGSFDNPFRMTDFGRIREAGFDHVRVNFFGFRYFDKKGKLDARVLDILDRVLDRADAEGLKVVLDQHDNQDCQTKPAGCKARLVSFWRQISARYARARPNVVYELLNEPGGEMSHAQWNAAAAAALAQIRAREPERLVIVGALNTSDMAAIEKLELPESDRRLIVSVHYYDPHRFTFQGASWSEEYAHVRDVAWGSGAARRQIVDDFALIARWGKAQDRPIYLGEFGALETAPPSSRAAWTRHVARTAESFGWGWAYWQFDHDFSLTDPVTRAWNTPLLDALIKRGAD